MVDPLLVIAAAALVGLVIVVAALLRAWQGWLALKERELERRNASDPDKGAPLGAARIEISEV